MVQKTNQNPYRDPNRIDVNLLLAEHAQKYEAPRQERRRQLKFGVRQALAASGVVLALSSPLAKDTLNAVEGVISPTTADSGTGETGKYIVDSTDPKYPDQLADQIVGDQESHLGLSDSLSDQAGSDGVLQQGQRVDVPIRFDDNPSKPGVQVNVDQK